MAADPVNFTLYYLAGWVAELDDEHGMVGIAKTKGGEVDIWVRKAFVTHARSK